MEVVSQERKDQILDLLNAIERENNITIIHAVESGSRAWGFPSANSDYDVRFIYHHAHDWYVTAFDKKDHIDVAICDDLDAAGWDVGKCMRLLYNGNAALQEWLRSPVVYRTDDKKLGPIHALADETFNPAAAFYHYLSLAKKKFSDQTTSRNAKYFLYGLRSLLCAHWVADKRSAPPVLFNELVDEYLSPEDKLQAEQILNEKVRGNENDIYEVPSHIWTWSCSTLKILASKKVEGRKQQPVERYDAVLLNIVRATGPSK